MQCSSCAAIVIHPSAPITSTAPRGRALRLIWNVTWRQYRRLSNRCLLSVATGAGLGAVTFVRGISNQVVEGLVDADTSAIEVQDQHAGRGAIEDGLEKLLISRMGQRPRRLKAVSHREPDRRRISYYR